MKRSKGFTLIELLAVIVILAIIALIATPMVLRYIENVKEGANESSVNTILRAADNYYASSLLKTNVAYPISFDLSNEEDIKELGLKGDAPEEGVVEIYENGTTFIEAMYNDTIYVKLPTQTKATKKPKVIGDSLIWTVENGVIKDYAMENNIEFKMERAVNETRQFGNYIQLALLYASADRSTTNSYIDFTKSLAENAAIYEESGQFSQNMLPQTLQDEIEVMLNVYNTERKFEISEIETIGETNYNELQHALDFYTKTELATSEITDDEVTQTTAYRLVYDSHETGIESNIVIVPNYVRQANGNVEKITAIGDGQLWVSNAKIGKDLIISYGIESIGDNAFYMQGLNSVVLPSTVKTIGNASFGINMLKSVHLPYNLETIGRDAFKHNQLEGELVIPKNVTTIGSSAFTAEKWTLDDATCQAFDALGFHLCNIKDEGNRIKKVTFENGSKIETIGSYAFNCSTLTSATIPRAPGTDLKIGNSAFGSVTPTYQS